ncbi:peptidoglycan-recognition protein LB-like isoform X2 [Ctenocephalides felis]|uniref:peptidoglycan-recognition protein LB-like isoform X2 n=1 Tax=Ctenocephalides felis TaxID=7515 RepID=UPI000E6E4132|nr:peptidoglycan-recognition protein LB-like isoform X2 [Ctenocephalides felis]
MAAIRTFLSMASIVGITNICELDIVSRKEWGAREPTQVEPIKEQLSHVIIHHSYIPGACGGAGQPACDGAMRAMQDYHQLEHGWNDIGYSFAVGGDGKIYEGRGWKVVGAHAPGYNFNSVGICLIGDWRTELPPEKMLKATKSLIECGVREGHLRKNYTLLGHLQVRKTECPGQRLYEEIKSWPNFEETEKEKYKKRAETQ